MTKQTGQHEPSTRLSIEEWLQQVELPMHAWQRQIVVELVARIRGERPRLFIPQPARRCGQTNLAHLAIVLAKTNFPTWRTPVLVDEIELSKRFKKKGTTP